MTTSIAGFQREAAQRERLSALGRLSTVIAHEIRNPLMIIKAALRTLRRDDVGAERARLAVRDIDEEVERLNRLVHDVLDFTKPVRVERAEASLSAICRGAATAAFAGGDEVPCRLALDAAADAVVTDAERLRQAIVNLLENARQAVLATPDPAANGDAEPKRPAQDDLAPAARAAAVAAGAPDAANAPYGAAREGRLVTFRPAWTAPPAGPRVELATCALDGDRVRVVVRDTGAGIAPADLPRVFEPYFTTRRTGSGLGLAITRNIVEGLGGSIAVDSTPGEGTEIRVDLPRTPRPPTSSPGATQA
jgi:signal transduction histidine kinase